MRKSEINLPIPSGGLNLIDDSLIAENEAAEGTINISFKNGIPQTRKGYIKKSNFNFVTEPKSIIKYTENGNKHILVASGGTLKKYDEIGDTFNDVVGVINSDYVEALNYPFKFADPDTYSDKLFILDGTSYQFYEDGENIQAVTAYTPTTEEITAYGTNVLETNPEEINEQKFILNDDERVWVAGRGKEVRISHLQRPDYFPSTQVWKLREKCTGMKRFMGEVMLFTENTATLISGSTPNWQLPEKYIYKELPTEYGCNSHRTITVGNNALYWANKNGVYRYRYLPSGFSIPECISEFEVATNYSRHIRSIKKYITNITDWSKIYATFYDNEYRLYISNKQWLIFDSISSAWSLYEYDKEFTDAITDGDKLYATGPYYYNLDFTYNPLDTMADGLNDDGVAIEFKLKSKFYDLGKPANKKKFKKLYFTFYSELISYDIDLILNLDNEYTMINDTIENYVSRWGEMAFGYPLQFRNTNLNYPIKIKHRGKKHNLQYEMTCNGLNQAFTLQKIVLLFKVKELK